MTCPVCGYKAKVLTTDAARSWARIQCENCSTYAMKADALAETPAFELFLLSGYYRHARHMPLTIQCDTQETVKEHIEEEREVVTKEYQKKLILRYYYHKMTHFGEYVELEKLPALAYAKDEEDLEELVFDAVENGYANLEHDRITVTRQGKEYLDMEQPKPSRTVKIFISHKHEDVEYAKAFVEFFKALNVPGNQIVCTSVSGHMIPNGENIYSWLRKQFVEYDLHVLLLLSKKYYTSPICLNEMGAAWVT